MNEINPPAIVREYQAAVEKVREARALDSEVRQDIARATHNVRVMGKLLSEAKSEVGHGKWLEFLGATWPELPERTARRWMRIFKSATVADLNEQIRAVTHAEAADDDLDEDDADDPPADRGDAYDEAEEPEAHKPAKARASRQPSLELDQEEVEARLREEAKRKAAEQLADLRMRAEEARDLADEVCRSAAGDEFQRQLRLSHVEFRRVPPTATARGEHQFPFLDDLIRIIDRTRAAAGLPTGGGA